MSEHKLLRVALAGQPNAGKSTLFNALTGARQHVANYPGVTVDKKYGQYRDAQGEVQTVDLPGTYSLSSFSLEERVAREFLITEAPDLVLNVVDAANLQRSLRLTLQLLEMERPLLLALNMMDVAQRRGILIDVPELASRLGVAVVPTVGRRGEGRDDLRQALREGGHSGAGRIDYGVLEDDLAALTDLAAKFPALADLPGRWLGLQLLEDDRQIPAWLAARLPTADAAALEDDAARRREAFLRLHGRSAADHIAACRDRKVSAVLDGVLQTADNPRLPLSARLDAVLLNRWAAPVFLLLTVFLIYQVAIVWGYEISRHTWPWLAGLREVAADLLPGAGFLADPYVRALGLWLVESVNTLLNYVPIFLILFALIAALEDSGYMARIAFILDRVLHRFGLHGQSTLPLILGGVFAGGCAVPGVMATKSIPDNRARMATILTVPFMNCLAKVPLYTLLLGIFFVEHKALMMFYIATISVIFALLVSKLLTSTVLRGEETAPFVMELPAYHLPTLGSVLRRAFDRTWLYVKKVGGIVLAVAVLVFVLLNFPGLPQDRQSHYEEAGGAALMKFAQRMEGNAHQTLISGDNLLPLINYYDDYRRARLNAAGADGARRVNERFAARNPDFFPLLSPAEGDADARRANRALASLLSERRNLRREMREERITRSVLGSIGRAMEPVTQFAGFDWKINVALLSSFAARESSVATLGVLFQQDEDQNSSLETRMGDETRAGGATALMATSLILFFILYPPCLATTIMIRIQTGSYKWMVFSIIFPTLLGLAVSSLVFTLGRITGASGIAMMSWTYFSALGLLLVLGLMGERKRPSMQTVEQEA